jgi:hypothetical protein
MATIPHELEQNLATAQDDAPWPEAAERAALTALASKAKAALPGSNGRVDKAVTLVLNHDIAYDAATSTALVGSGTDAQTVYRVRGKVCECPDATRAPQGLCKHVLGVMLLIRLEQELSTAPQAAPDPEPEPAPAPEPEPHEAVSGIDPRWIQLIHGKPHVRYQGLLAMAHERGLVSLKARFVGTPTLELAVAEAEATFADGRVFVECGDATPANIQASHIRPHLLRMALTRAKSRALRDALNIGEAAVEELE